MINRAGADRGLTPDAELATAGRERIAVALVQKASADLQRTQARTQLSRTDILNRAVSFYAFVDAEQSSGSELILRRGQGEEHIVRLL
jgi:hypothetical protein